MERRKRITRKSALSCLFFLWQSMICCLWACQEYAELTTLHIFSNKRVLPPLIVEGILDLNLFVFLSLSLNGFTTTPKVVCPTFYHASCLSKQISHAVRRFRYLQAQQQVSHSIKSTPTPFKASTAQPGYFSLSPWYIFSKYPFKNCGYLSSMIASLTRFIRLSKKCTL